MLWRYNFDQANEIDASNHEQIKKARLLARLICKCLDGSEKSSYQKRFQLLDSFLLQTIIPFGFGILSK